MAEVQAVFLEKMFLWGFIVAWGNSETHTDGRKMIVKPVEPLPKPLAVHIEPEASGSKPPAHCP